MPQIGEQGQQIDLMAGGLSGAMDADFTSRAHNVLAEAGRHGSITIEWAAGATPVGVVYVRGSNDDKDTASADVANWENVPGLTFALSGDTGVQTLILETVALSYTWLDLFYDRTSGDGTVSRVSLVLKG